MPTLPQAVIEALENRKGPVVFTTVAPDGTPNSAWVGCVDKCEEERIMLADNYFHKTRANILAGSRGSLLWITEDGTSYQVKGRIEYLTEGALYEKMREWVKDMSADLPAVAATVLHIEEAYSGAEKLL